MSELKSLSKDIFDGYGNCDVVGIAYFKRWSADLLAHNYSDVLAYQMSNYPHRYVLDFILGTPFLWGPLGSSFWTALLVSADRPDTARAIEQVGAFSDIEFLSRYVEVDALRYLWEECDISEGHRKSLLLYFQRHGYALVPSRLDDDDLDGDYFVGKAELLSLADELSRDFKFKKIELNDGNVASYVDALKS